MATLPVVFATSTSEAPGDVAWANPEDAISGQGEATCTVDTAVSELLKLSSASPEPNQQITRFRLIFDFSTDGSADVTGSILVDGAAELEITETVGSTREVTLTFDTPYDLSGAELGVSLYVTTSAAVSVGISNARLEVDTVDLGAC